MKNQKKYQKRLQISDEQIIIQNKINKLLHFLPNLALEDVPVGKDEKTNKLIEQYGSIKKFTFKPEISCRFRVKKINK